MKLIKDFFLGICAGAAIAFGGFLNILSKTFVPDLYGKILGSMLFPIGLCLVCFLSLALFTGKIGYAFDNKPKYLLYLLTIYAGNFVGAFAIGFLFHLFFNTTSLLDTANAIANVKSASFDDVGSGFTTFGNAMLCGALVYLAVASYKKFDKIYLKVIGSIIPIALFVFLGFDHCIANMFYFAGAYSGLAFRSWKVYANVFTATIGNSIGAILLNFVFRIKKVN